MDITDTIITEAFTQDKGWQPVDKPLTEDTLVSLMSMGVEQVHIDAEGFEHNGDYGVKELFTELHKINYEQGDAFARLGDVSV